MSIETWKKEFYPIDACEILDKTDADVVSHSLKKWEGLKASNLKKHGVKKDGGIDGIVVFDKDENEHFTYNWSTCALCLKFHYRVGCGYCDTCPITISGGLPCDETGSAYDTSCSTLNPQPMIKVLKFALKHVEEQLKTKK